MQNFLINDRPYEESLFVARPFSTVQHFDSLKVFDHRVSDFLRIHITNKSSVWIVLFILGGKGES